jgi:hypothetical protein
LKQKVFRLLDNGGAKEVRSEFVDRRSRLTRPIKIYFSKNGGKQFYSFHSIEHEIKKRKTTRKK